MKCLSCNKDHNGLFGSGKYCSRSCANKRILSENTKLKISNTLKVTKYKEPVILHNRNNKTIQYIADLSLRTKSKILKRANCKCSMCGWDKTSLDIHHIIFKKFGGTENNDNLIILCPNCHRMAHEKQYSIDELKEKSIEKTLPNWFDYVK